MDRQPLLLWDWDDTLMCSSAINAHQVPPASLQELETCIEQVLSLSKKLGETIIVTNADDIWVLESSRRIAPRVLPLLSEIPVVSARKLYEQQWPGDCFAWKREAFREVLVSRRFQGRPLNLIVLGDSPAEIDAAHKATMGLPSPMSVKTVKFKDLPSVDEVIEQLRIVQQELPRIVADGTNSHRNLLYWMRRSRSPDMKMSASTSVETMSPTYTDASLSSSAFACTPAAAAASVATFPYARTAGRDFPSSVVCAASH